MNIFFKIKYHFEQLLFERLAIPKVKNENISKIILKKYLPKNPFIIDCGAHNGADTVELYNRLKGTVHAFEPVDNLFKRLVNRTAFFKIFIVIKLL